MSDGVEKLDLLFDRFIKLGDNTPNDPKLQLQAWGNAYQVATTIWQIESTRRADTSGHADDDEASPDPFHDLDA